MAGRGQRRIETRDPGGGMTTTPHLEVPGRRPREVPIVSTPREIPVSYARLADSDEESSSSSSSSEESSLSSIHRRNLFDNPSPHDVSLDVPDSGYLEVPETPFEDSIVIRGGNKIRTSDSSSPTTARHFLETEISSAKEASSSVSVHISGQFGAFISSGLVNVVDLRNGRKLILDHNKSMKEACDVSFARIFDRIILASVDSHGSIVVLDIDDSLSKSRTMLEIIEKSSGRDVGKRIIHWCPYIPESEEEILDADCCVGSLVLAVAHQNIADVYNIHRLLKSRSIGGGGENNPITVAGLPKGHVRVVLQHPINHFEMSLDGGAMAFSSNDGVVYFYDYHVDKRISPSCVYTWRPMVSTADDVPTSLFFLDDKTKKIQPDTSGWSFVLVGSRGNSVMSLWSCKDWRRIQTCTILSSKMEERKSEEFLSAIDPAGKFLLLANASSPRMFILRLDFYKDQEGLETVRFASVQEVTLPFTIVSLAIRSSDQAAVSGNQKREKGGDDQKKSSFEMVAAHESGVANCKVTLLDKDSAPAIEILQQIIARKTKTRREASLTIGKFTTSAKNDNGGGQDISDEDTSSQSSSSFEDIISTASGTVTKIVAGRESELAKMRRPLEQGYDDDDDDNSTEKEEEEEEARLKEVILTPGDATGRSANTLENVVGAESEKTIFHEIAPEDVVITDKETTILLEIASEMAKLRRSFEDCLDDCSEEAIVREVISKINDDFSSEIKTIHISTVESFRERLDCILANKIPKIIEDFLAAKLERFASEVIERAVREIPEIVVKGVEEAFRGKLLPGMTENVRKMFAKMDVKEEEVYTVRKKVKTLVGQGRMEEALVAALDSDDSGLVLETCGEINLSTILGCEEKKKKALLTTDTLLATLKSLSRDLEGVTVTKIQYLKDLLLSVDLDEPAVRKEFQEVKDLCLQEVERALDDDGKESGRKMEPIVVRDLRVLKIICQMIMKDHEEESRES